MVDVASRGTAAVSQVGSGQRVAVETVVIGVTALTVSLTQSLLIPVLPILPTALHSSAQDVGWVLTSTLLVGAVAVPTMGRLGDLYGRRRMLLVAVMALAIGSLLCAVSTNLPLMVAGRAVTGISVAAIPLGISIIAASAPPGGSGSGIALISAMLGVGGSLGLPLAGLVVAHGDYHLLFWICLVVAAVSFVGCLLFVPVTAVTPGGRVDVLGVIVLSAGLVLLLLPLSQVSVWGWQNPRTWTLLALAVVTLVVFVLVERRRASPLVDIRASARGAVMMTNLASLFVGFALFASFIGTAPYVQAPLETGYGFGVSVLVSGLCLLPSGVAMLVLSPVSARMTNRWGPKRTLAIGSVVIAAGFLIRICLTSALWQVVVGTTLAGAGTGIAYSAMPALILRATPPSESAAANGLNALFRSTGSALSSAVGGTILATYATAFGPGLVLPSLAGYEALFITCGAAALTAAVIASLIRAPQSVTPGPA